MRHPRHSEYVLKGSTGDGFMIGKDRDESLRYGWGTFVVGVVK